LADLQWTVYPHSGHPSAEGRAQDRVSYCYSQLLAQPAELIANPVKSCSLSVCLCVCLCVNQTAAAAYTAPTRRPRYSVT